MDNAVTPPKYVKEVMRKLEERNWGAYLVGSCSRDMLIGIQPNDWQIATSATYDNIASRFESTELKNDKIIIHMSHKKKVYVNTFRQQEKITEFLENTGKSAHRIADISQELRGQDFTINAVALPLKGLIMDPFGGLEDIKKRVIRTVSQPEKYFRSNPSKMFDAYVLASKLTFRLDSETETAIKALSHVGANLPPDIICGSLNKILHSSQPQTVHKLVENGLLDKYLKGRDLSAEEASGLARIEKNRLMRWAGFCSLLMSKGLIYSPSDFLKALDFKNEHRRIISYGIELSKALLPCDRCEYKLAIKEHGYNNVLCACAALDVLTDGEHCCELKRLEKSGECFTLNRLAIKGEDLIAIGYEGSQIGIALNELLEHVIRNPKDNVKNVLITRAAYSMPKSIPVIAI